MSSHPTLLKFGSLAAWILGFAAVAGAQPCSLGWPATTLSPACRTGTEVLSCPDGGIWYCSSYRCASDCTPITDYYLVPGGGALHKLEVYDCGVNGQSTYQVRGCQWHLGGSCRCDGAPIGSPVLCPGTRVYHIPIVCD
jgi:hypothetical protein